MTYSPRVVARVFNALRSLSVGDGGGNTLMVTAHCKPMSIAKVGNILSYLADEGVIEKVIHGRKDLNAYWRTIPGAELPIRVPKTRKVGTGRPSERHNPYLLEAQF